MDDTKPKKVGNPNWVKGMKSPNPGGRYSCTKEMVVLAQTYTEECILALVDIMRRGVNNERLRAAQLILERGHGKPVQEINATVETTDTSYEDVSTRVAAILASAVVESDTDPVDESN